MGWIDVNDKLPPEGLNVLVEASGHYSAGYSLIADHSFFIGSYIVPVGEEEGEWLLYDATPNEDVHMWTPEVHAWMPLPKHYQPQEIFHQEKDLMEHSMFEEEPEYLYKGDCVYEQMTLEDFLGGANE